MIALFYKLHGSFKIFCGFHMPCLFFHQALLMNSSTITGRTWFYFFQVLQQRHYFRFKKISKPVFFSGLLTFFYIAYPFFCFKDHLIYQCKLVIFF